MATQIYLNHPIKNLNKSMEFFSKLGFMFNPQYPPVVITVDDVKESIKKIIDAGGKMIGKPMEIPDVGQYFSFIDTEGNRVSMLQPIPHNLHAPKPG